MIERIGRKRPYRLYLREWADSRGLSGDDLAGRMDCTPGTVSKLINGKMKQTPEWLARFADALGTDVEITDLFRHPDAPTQQDLLRGLPQAEQDRIIRAIRALTGTDN